MKEIKVYVEKDGYLESDFIYINPAQIITIERSEDYAEEMDLWNVRVPFEGNQAYVVNRETATKLIRGMSK